MEIEYHVLDYHEDIAVWIVELGALSKGAGSFRPDITERSLRTLAPSSVLLGLAFRTVIIGLRLRLNAELQRNLLL